MRQLDAMELPGQHPHQRFLTNLPDSTLSSDVAIGAGRHVAWRDHGRPSGPSRSHFSPLRSLTGKSPYIVKSYSALPANGRQHLWIIAILAYQTQGISGVRNQNSAMDKMLLSGHFSFPVPTSKGNILFKTALGASELGHVLTLLS